MRRYPPLFPHVPGDFLTPNPLAGQPGLHFFDHGRSALSFLVRQLRAEARCYFLLPCYTCPTVVQSVLGQTDEVNFVDLDEGLDFDLKDLERVRSAIPPGCRVVLLPTHLFGVPTRDYKKLYPDCTIIEDRAQSMLSPDSTADFQVGSFGRGKLIGTWNGGVIRAKDPRSLADAYRALPPQRDFARAYALSLAQVVISKYLWSWLERTPLNPERGPEQAEPPCPVRRSTGLKTRWMANGLTTFDPARRLAIGRTYREGIRPELQYALGERLPLLRYPVKAGAHSAQLLSRSGLSQLRSYRRTYEIAKQRRAVALEGGHRLAYQSWFLPQHELLSDAYVEETIAELNGSTQGTREMKCGPMRVTNGSGR